MIGRETKGCDGVLVAVYMCHMEADFQEFKETNLIKCSWLAYVTSNKVRTGAWSNLPS
jgi:hypothetical protein